jgi:hypothetical protein
MRRSTWSFIVGALALAVACSSDGITNSPGVTPTLSIVSGGGDNQTGTAGATLPTSLAVQVSGVSGSVNGQLLNFVVTSGGGSVFATAVMTGTPASGPFAQMRGIAENTWTLGGTGPQTVEARLVDPVTGATLTQATFHATAVPGPVYTLKLQSGDKQTAVVDATLSNLLRVAVMDNVGAPIPGVAVAFTTAAGHGSPSASSATTGADGSAAISWRLGHKTGEDTLTATVVGHSSNPVTFTATAIPGAATQLVSVTGDGQHAAPASTLPLAPTVRVRDGNNNPVSGVAVTFTVTAGGGSMDGITSVTTLTNRNGKASVDWTLGSTPGANTLRATALGLNGSPVIFGATAFTPLYVANQNSNSITVYEAESDGNVSPVRTIAGSSTGLSLPGNIVLDQLGQLYVTNYTGNSVTIYAAGASGNAAPVRTISGPATGFTRPFALTRDAAGQIYVFDYATSSILIFAATATGNATPLRTIAGGSADLHGVSALQVSASGEIYAADQDLGNIKVFAAGANGNVAPIRVISGPNTGFLQPTDLVLDAAGRLYVSTFNGNSIVEFPAGANGDATPLRIINGSNTMMSVPVGLSLDSSGNIYVANYTAQRITVYASDASGNAAPVRTISGANTNLNAPGWLAF